MVRVHQNGIFGASKTLVFDADTYTVDDSTHRLDIQDDEGDTIATFQASAYSYVSVATPDTVEAK